MKIFSIPLNPKLSEVEFNTFVQFCEKYKDYIYDIYFTCRIPPFIQDAMGDVFVREGDYQTAIDMALYFQNTLGISISATFNNIHINPTQENLDVFIENFRPLYDLGIHSATIPHTHWVATGQLQKEFPKLYIKNTILRNIDKPSEVALAADAGFHYINLDRSLMRDQETLLKVKKVKELKGIQISLLANEGCVGKCSMMDEHFTYNTSRKNEPQYFNSAISRVSCPKWDNLDPSIPLKTANFPPWREDWVEFLENGIDVFKMHGRENIPRLFESMEIIKLFAEEKELVSIPFDGFEKYDKTAISLWREKIKTCKFDCWECNYCDSIVKVKPTFNGDEKAKRIALSLVESVNSDFKKPDIPGLSSLRVLKLLNSFAKFSNNYLEVGSYLGLTLSSVVMNNKIDAYVVDHWESQVQPENGDVLPANNKTEFIKNIKNNNPLNNRIQIFDCDFQSVDLANLKDVDLFFYDGDHSYGSVKRSIEYFSSVFAETCLMIFDDANWQGVVDGAEAGIESTGLVKLYEKKMLNGIEDNDQWWNGLYIVLVRKK